MNKWKLGLLTFLTASFLTSLAVAETTVIWWDDGDDGDTFDGDSTNKEGADTTATFGGYTFTTLDVGIAGDNTESWIDTKSVDNTIEKSTLAVNSGGGSLKDGGAKFDFGEYWTFSVDQDFYWAGMNIQALTNPGETLYLECSAWVGLDITPANEFIQFNSASGTFTFTDSGAVENYEAGDLDTTYAGLFVPANTPIKIGVPDDGGVSTVHIRWFIFSDTLPEAPGPTYSGLAYFMEGWMYLFDDERWVSVTNDPVMYDYTGQSWTTGSQSGIAGFMYFDYPATYTLGDGGWFFIDGDMELWDSVEDATIVLPIQ